jgi:hypothetical protein
MTAPALAIVHQMAYAVISGILVTADSPTASIDTNVQASWRLPLVRCSNEQMHLPRSETLQIECHR